MAFRDDLNTLLSRLRAKDDTLVEIKWSFILLIMFYFCFWPSLSRHFQFCFGLADIALTMISLNFTNIGNAGLGRIVACLPGNTHLREIRSVDCENISTCL